MIREIVFQKYDGKCAYCGCDLELHDLKIDHFIPQKKGGTDDVDNLMPSCEICNHYKDSHSIYKFKSMMKRIKNKISKLYIIKVAQRYNLISIKDFTEFYYERIKKGD